MGAIFPLPWGYPCIRQRRQRTAHPVSGQETWGSWDSPDEVVLVSVAIATASTQEVVTDSRRQVITRMAMYAPLGVDVLPVDRIVDPYGRVWEVTGDAAEWASPLDGTVFGVEIPLTRWRG